MARPKKAHDPFRGFDSSPEVIRTAVMMYVKSPLSFRNAEVLLAERGIDIRHETVSLWWNRFGPMFAVKRLLADIEINGECGDRPLQPRSATLAQPMEPNIREAVP